MAARDISARRVACDVFIANRSQISADHTAEVRGKRNRTKNMQVWFQESVSDFYSYISLDEPGLSLLPPLSPLFLFLFNKQ